MSQARPRVLLRIVPWLALCLTVLGSVASVVILFDEPPGQLLYYKLAFGLGECSYFCTRLSEFTILGLLWMTGWLSGLILACLALFLALIGRIHGSGRTMWLAKLSCCW